MLFPPAGCLYIGDALKKAGYSVRVHHLYDDQIREAVFEIATSHPLFVGFSVMTGTPVSLSAQMSRLLKEAMPEIPIVWGGIHPTLLPELCLKEDAVDYVVRGEGEITVIELADALSKGRGVESLAGVNWKDTKGRIRSNPDRPFMKDLDQFRQDWSLVDPNKYVLVGAGGVKYTSFITSRGCPHKCGFCYNVAFNKRRWRAHSIGFVLSEIGELAQSTGITQVRFHDDNFFVNEERALQILEGLILMGIQPSWIELRLDQIHNELLRRLSELDIVTVFVGWESGSSATLKRIDKGFTPSLIVKSFRLFSKYSFTVDASGILGFPFENESDWKATVDMALKIDRINPGRNRINLGIYTPYPGTSIVAEAEGKGFKYPTDIMDWGCLDQERIAKGNPQWTWLTSKNIRYFGLLNQYLKLLHYEHKGKRIIASVRRIFALLARARLSTGLFWLPIDLFIYQQMIRFLEWNYSRTQKARKIKIERRYSHKILSS